MLPLDLDKVSTEFVTRSSHLERLVEGYNPRLDRCELEPVQFLPGIVPFQARHPCVVEEGNLEAKQQSEVPNAPTRITLVKP